MFEVGMYGGSFNPLHMGHVRCMVKAATRCNELNIVISQGIARDEVDLTVKYRWIYMMTKHLPNVRIHILEDSCESKEAYGKELWKTDAEKVKEMIGKKIDVVFCGDDYKEGDNFYKMCYPESEIIYFERDNISSTLIRSNPYKYWDMLPECVRPYYVKKVMLIGGESVGKSTMTIQLARYYNTTFIDEAGRDISMRSGTDKMMMMDDYTDILLTHKMNERKAIEGANKVLFIDTDCLITQFYLEFLNEHTKGKKEHDVLADAIAGINRYDLVIFLEPDVEFVQDGTRNEAIREQREHYSKRIKEIYDAHGIQYQSVSGDYSTRLEQVIQLVDKLLK
ncbi:MAG: multifunctional transcriptional regulator/nicotinamide-nucleotide adenylyltransferase/ribosylnicotinamide kinase NadR [Lachnospiraceae bacterium]|nr:multifunctional transcriptional regulator/nicotinamide-nucleotide adenylyltransferase/ribosylnicotinamide kinase NadR [Lachnospiraceae bacterium]